MNIVLLWLTLVIPIFMFEFKYANRKGKRHEKSNNA